MNKRNQRCQRIWTLNRTRSRLAPAIKSINEEMCEVGAADASLLKSCGKGQKNERHLSSTREYQLPGLWGSRFLDSGTRSSGRPRFPLFVVCSRLMCWQTSDLKGGEGHSGAERILHTQPDISIDGFEAVFIRQVNMVCVFLADPDPEWPADH